MNTSVLNDDPTAATNAAQLAALARKAYEQKRIKECLGLINQLLLCDPGNTEELTLKAAVFSDMEHDLADARVLLADSQERNDRKYRKAAEIILLKILYLDPAHTEAKSLLASSRATAEMPQSAPVSVEAAQPKPPMLEEVGFTALPSPVQTKPESRDSRITPKLPVLFIGLFLLAAGGFFLYRPGSAISAPARDAAVETPASVQEPSSAGLKTAAYDASEVVPPTDPRALLAAMVPPTADLPAAGSPAVSNQVSAPGFLTVNSPISAEVYMDGKLLGEAPTTLQLPAGLQTLEYRRGDLRTVMTHEIKSKETTTVLVTLDVTVQINARPWAQVFLDGAVRKPLGQTPLSSVRVPLGSVLAFENPNFPSKSHRVTETDSSIQVAFP